jgi:bile-acid 7alpha-dehydratase
VRTKSIITGRPAHTGRVRETLVSEEVEMNPLGEIEARVRKLEDIEAIKKLKAKYWRCVDRKLWGEMTEVFTEEAVADYGPDIKLKGKQAIVDFLKGSLGADTVITSHVGQRPEIELTGESTATGTWWLNDYIVMQPNIRRRGYAFYEDEYVKENGKWKKKSTKVTTMLEEWDMLKR